MDPTDWPYHGCRHFSCREDGLKSCAAPDVWSRADVIAKLWARTSKESHFQGVSPIFWRSFHCWWQIEACFNTVWPQEFHHTTTWSPRISRDRPRISRKYTSRCGMGVEQNKEQVLDRECSQYDEMSEAHMCDISMYAAPTNQNMADLTPERCLQIVRPFILIHWFGFLCQSWSITSDRIWLCVTCFSTSTIHLEMPISLDSDTFSNAFIRFFTRRGAPQKILSHNGKSSRTPCWNKALRAAITTALYMRAGDRMWTGHLIHRWLPTMAECGGIWSDLFAAYYLHSWFPRWLWQMTYCTLCCAKLKIWLTVGHWPKAATMPMMRMPWIRRYWYWSADGTNSVSWYWMVYFDFVLAPPFSCSTLCATSYGVLCNTFWRNVNKRP